jgi:AraC family transcriptional regulator
MSENKTHLLTDIRTTEIGPCRVAYYRAVGKNPETAAWRVLSAWADENQLAGTSRRFGFDNPGPSSDSPEYGYEVWIVVGDDIEGSGEVRIKNFEGGRFAVLRTDLSEIGRNWQRLMRWIRSSQFDAAPGQCLEESLSPPGTPEDSLILDLHLPITG